MSQTRAYAVHELHAAFAPLTIERREPGPDDVVIDIAYCGLCHSDVHQVKNEWGGTVFPIVPGHEIVGTVAKVGKNVTSHKPGDRVGVGCMVNSCRVCEPCQRELEQFCEKGNIGTYNARDLDGTITYGGYSQQVVVDQHFVLRIDPALGDLSRVAPLLCAGITTYSPLKHWKVGPGSKVAVVGLGGLGHMGVKIAKALGAEVTVITRNERKRADALALGADDVIYSSDAELTKRHAGRFDFVLDTVSAEHDYNQLLALVRVDGVVCCVGAPPDAAKVRVFSLIGGRKTLVGSLIGGIAETQEMLDFCAKHHVLSDIELVRADGIEAAYERMLAGDVKYRFVLDAASL